MFTESVLNTRSQAINMVTKKAKTGRPQKRVLLGHLGADQNQLKRLLILVQYSQISRLDVNEPVVNGNQLFLSLLEEYQ
jgi:hypothetical protein